MSELIERAKEIRSELNIGELRKAGIRRNRKEYEFVTTYPTIPALSPISQEDIFTGKPREREVQFYVHIPFCTGKCTYCTKFLTFPKVSRKNVEKYLDYLEKEMGIINTIPELEMILVGSIYVGGGTPTYLSTKQLSRLTKSLNSQLNILEGAEFTVESSVETFSRDKVEALSENGVNRLSIGIQSYDDDILKLCKRRHNGKQAREVTKLARGSGFDNVNIDLIFGLPLQTPERWEENLRTALESGTSCITAYPLYTTPGSEMAEMPDDLFPTEEDNLLMAIMAMEFFADLGYEQGPVHFFAKPGVVSLDHNIKKWEGKGEGTIGLGPYVYQFINNIQYRNFFNMQKYRDAIDSGRLPIWIGKQLDRDEQMARAMVLGMKSGRVDKELFENKFEAKPEYVFPEKIKRMENLGLIEATNDSIKLSYTGKLYSEEVAVQFYSDEIRHAIENAGAKYAGYLNTSNI